MAGFEPSTNSVGNAVANALSKVEGKRVNAAWSLGELKIGDSPLFCLF